MGYDANLSRVTAITNGGSNTYAAYTYLGADTIVDTAHPGVTGGLDLSMGPAEWIYGLDQWSRAVDQVFKSGDVTVDEYKYGYDADGDRLWKQNAGPAPAAWVWTSIITTMTAFAA